MTVILRNHTVNDSVLFKVATYAADGTTLVTPTSATCSVFAEDGTAIVTNGTGAVGAGYAQYNWAGTATAGRYSAVLNVTLSAGVIQSETFEVLVLAEPTLFTTDLETDIGQMRMELGDDENGAGVRPNGKNLTDAQLQVLLDREGTVMRAVAAACELLARQWSVFADRTLGPLSESRSQVAKSWRDRANELRGQFGYGTEGASGAFSYSPVRVDGYSVNADAEGEYSE